MEFICMQHVGIATRIALGRMVAALNAGAYNVPTWHSSSMFSVSKSMFFSEASP